MTIRRRDFLTLAGAATLSGSLPRLGAQAADNAGVYDLERFGNARILHITDTHAQLRPVFFREPSVNLGVGPMRGNPPHLVGRAFLDRFGIRPDSADAYAFTCIEFEKAAGRFGKLGGFAHLKTLVDRMRSEAGAGRALLLDGGDLWQGTGLSNTLQGADMVDAANLLGIEAMTGHWEFTYGEKALRANLERFKGEFLAQNVFLTEEAAFNDAKAFDPASGRVFKPSIIKEIGGYRIAVIGQAFPYVPIAHPKRFTPDWKFGIRDEELQKLVDVNRNTDKVDAVILLSHNGMDVDLKLASRVTGIDVILGGHTHDAVPQPIAVTNPGGVTLVTNAGSNGKFLAVLDLEIGKGKVANVRYRLLPVFSELLKPDTGDAGADRQDTRAACGGAGRKDRRRRPPALSPRQFQRQHGPADLRRTARRIGCRDRAVAGLPLGHHRTGGPAADDGGRDGADRRHLSGDLYPDHDRRPDQGRAGRHLRQSLQHRSLLPAGRRHGPRRRSRLHLQSERDRGQADFRTQARQRPGLQAGKSYKVAGWASVNEQNGAPIWDVVARHLRSGKPPNRSLPGVTLKGVEDNPGIAGQG